MSLSGPIVRGVTDAVRVGDGRVVPGATTLPRMDHLVPEAVREYVIPVMMALLCVIAVLLTASRVGLLLDWSDRYDGAGEHVVSACSADEVAGGQSWLCSGALVADGSTVDVRSDLITSRGASASSRPYVGQRTDVFFDSGNLGVVHPTAYRLNEMARLFVSLLPRLLLVGGTLIWLAGWALTRRLDTTDLLVRDSVRLPGRFVWQRRGITWLVVGVGAFVAAHLLTGQVIGSLGTF